MPGCSGGHTGLGKARLEAVSKSSGVSGDHFCAVRDENSVVGGGQSRSLDAVRVQLALSSLT